MSRRNTIGALEKIVEVRHLQRRAAELKVAKADAALLKLSRRQEEETGHQDDRQQEWERSVAAASFSLELASSWSRCVVEGENAIALIKAEVGIAEQKKKHEEGEWRQTMAQVELAETLQMKAVRDVKRRLEQKNSNSLDDRTSFQEAAL